MAFCGVVCVEWKMERSSGWLQKWWGAPGAPRNMFPSSVELLITSIMSTSAVRNALDLERSEILLEEILLSFLHPLDRSGTVCFVCLDCPRNGQYAVQVQCLKSGRGRKIIEWSLGDPDDESPSDAPSHSKQGPEVKTSKATPVRRPPQTWDTVLEDDRAVYIRMLNICFQYIGKWRKWLPFYGVVSVTEVMASLKETVLLGEILGTNQEPLQ